VLGAARDSVTRGLTRRGFTVDDFKRLQHDEYSLQASLLVPELLKAASAANTASQWEYRTLAGWDYVMRAGATAPLLFETWKRALSSLAARRVAGNDRAATMIGDGSWLDEWAAPNQALRLVPDAERAPLMRAAMDTALLRIQNRLGADRATWTWGTIHTASFAHRIAAAYDPAVVHRGGDGNTVNSTAGGDYRQQYGASFREILDVADWDRSVATSVPGQSGQPESVFYANLLPLWGRGEYFPLVYSRAAVERETTHVLWLVPRASANGKEVSRKR